MTESAVISNGEVVSPPERPAFGFDQSSLIESQQRQIDAFGRATTIISATVSAVITKQFDLLQKEAEQFAAEMNILFDTRHPADMMPKQVETARHAFDETLAGLREISDIARQGALDLFDVMRTGLPRDLSVPPAPPAEVRKAAPARQPRAA